ncbi:ABC transporter ATP-binding protein [Microbispora sp. NPDC049125]|uniref:ABC transporter ATP-binding protein n=1 Tax=Microbispora sp. NPDC049125 TaxID=3154929 RepID=UPI003466CEFA
MTTHAVAARRLRKDHGGTRAVDGVDLLITPGEVVALLGPNGAGKSTLIEMITGLTRPDTGEITVFGDAPVAAVRSGAVGVMLQEAGLLDDVTVQEAVAMIASLHRAPLPVEEALRRAGLTDLAARRSARLSGGEKQRVRFAMALVPGPDLLILDEPTSAMDVAARRDFWRSMRDFGAAGRTVLFATHYLEEAEQHADRVVFMRDGAVVADGPVSVVLARVSGRTVRAAVPDARLDELRALPGVAGVELRGGRAELRSADADAVVRELLARFPGTHDIEVIGAGLDEAFIRLTEEEAAS